MGTLTKLVGMFGGRRAELPTSRTQQSLAADGAIACFSNSFFLRGLNADRAPQLKAVVMLLRLCETTELRHVQVLDNHPPYQFFSCL
jgi:hypothetical protein